MRLALLKHAHHSFDIDHPGKDSYELRKAGADQVLVASRHRMALIKECRGPSREPRLSDLLPCVDTRDLDLVLVEGFKHEAIPKIELYRPSLGRPLIHATDSNVIAVASDEPFCLERGPAAARPQPPGGDLAVRARLAPRSRPRWPRRAEGRSGAGLIPAASRRGDRWSGPLRGASHASASRRLEQRSLRAPVGLLLGHQLDTLVHAPAFVGGVGCDGGKTGDSLGAQARRGDAGVPDERGNHRLRPAPGEFEVVR